MMQVLLNGTKLVDFSKTFRHPLDESYVVSGYESDDALEELRGGEHLLSGMGLSRSFGS